MPVGGEVSKDDVIVGEAGAAGSAPAGKVRVTFGGEVSKDDVGGGEAGAAGSAPAGSVRVAIGGEVSIDDVVVGEAGAAGSAPAGKVRVTFGARCPKMMLVVVKQVLQVQHLLVAKVMAQQRMLAEATINEGSVLFAAFTAFTSQDIWPAFIQTVQIHLQSGQG